MQYFYDRSAYKLKPLQVRYLLLIQNQISKQWDCYSTILECHKQARRYLIKLESGMLIRPNGCHLRKRLSDLNFTNNSDSDNVNNNDANETNCSNSGCYNSSSLTNKSIDIKKL